MQYTMFYRIVKILFLRLYNQHEFPQIPLLFADLHLLWKAAKIPAVILPKPCIIPRIISKI